jgi:hypothetical protein
VTVSKIYKIVIEATLFSTLLTITLLNRDNNKDKDTIIKDSFITFNIKLKEEEEEEEEILFN